MALNCLRNVNNNWRTFVVKSCSEVKELLVKAVLWLLVMIEKNCWWKQCYDCCSSVKRIVGESSCMVIADHWKELLVKAVLDLLPMSEKNKFVGESSLRIAVRIWGERSQDCCSLVKEYKVKAVKIVAHYWRYGGWQQSWDCWWSEDLGNMILVLFY